jgi:hypothetical protein
MLNLSELEMRILSELEEAGEENVPTIANTVTNVRGDQLELSEIRSALESLVRADLIRIALDGRDMNAQESLGVLAVLETHLIFNSEGKHWTGGSEPWPDIIATRTGKETAFQILDERGYQWWRTRS